MNESFYIRVIKNWLKASLVLHTWELKEDNGKTKTKCWAVDLDLDFYGVREGSPVGVQWAVRLVGEDLWWKGFVE